VHKHLRRLERVWIDFPIYYITTCVRHRKSVLAEDEAARILVEEWRAAHTRHGWAVGRYVIMPNHVHFFCRAEIGAKTLSDFVGNWKSWTSRAINALDRGQRLRLQRCGNASFLITSCVPMKAMLKSGITSEIILFVMVWYPQQTIGRMLARSKH
jgi:REP element-mobilizing transposase RayT